MEIGDKFGGVLSRDKDDSVFFFLDTWGLFKPSACLVSKIL